MRITTDVFHDSIAGCWVTASKYCTVASCVTFLRLADAEGDAASDAALLYMLVADAPL